VADIAQGGTTLIRLPPFLSLIALASLLAAGGCGSATPAASSSATPAAVPVVKKVDHVAISSQDPAALFKVLSGPLGLPVAWPFAKYPGFATGGVHAGNVNIETLHFGSPAKTSAPGAMCYGIVLEPYPLAESVPELKKRGAEPGKEEVQTTEIGGKQVPAWTNVTLKALCGPEYTVYLCEYTPAMKSRLAGRQTTGPQGPLGIVSAEKIVVTSKDATKLRDTWSTTMAPDKMSTDGVLAMGSGPAIQVDQGGEDAITALVFRVKSLAAAKSALQSAGLLGTASATELTVDPAKVQGLQLVFVQE
jgi:hypothetical protein